MGCSKVPLLIFDATEPVEAPGQTLCIVGVVGDLKSMMNLLSGMVDLLESEIVHGFSKAVSDFEAVEAS